jgi:hypothetical protein
VLPSGNPSNSELHVPACRESTLHINVDSRHVSHAARMTAENAHMASPTCPLLNASVANLAGARTGREANRQ